MSPSVEYTTSLMMLDCLWKSCAHDMVCRHRYLQSSVGTWARLGYAAFDAQLRRAHFVTTLYAIRMSVHAYAICW